MKSRQSALAVSVDTSNFDANAEAISSRPTSVSSICQMKEPVRPKQTYSSASVSMTTTSPSTRECAKGFLIKRVEVTVANQDALTAMPLPCRMLKFNTLP